MKSTNYKTSHYAIFLPPVTYSLSGVQILPSAPRSQTYSDCVRPSTWHITLQITYAYSSTSSTSFELTDWRWLFFWAITLMMEEARTSETAVNFCQNTWRDNQEDSHLHTDHRENLKPHNWQLPSPATTSYSFQAVLFHKRVTILISSNISFIEMCTN